MWILVRPGVSFPSPGCARIPTSAFASPMLSCNLPQFTLNPTSVHTKPYLRSHLSPPPDECPAVQDRRAGPAPDSLAGRPAPPPARQAAAVGRPFGGAVRPRRRDAVPPRGAAPRRQRHAPPGPSPAPPPPAPGRPQPESVARLIKPGRRSPGAHAATAAAAAARPGVL